VLWYLTAVPVLLYCCTAGLLDSWTADVPGSNWVPRHLLDVIPKELDRLACVVLISADDTDSRAAARALHALGMPFVAAMAGGMKGWKFSGFQTSRDRSILQRFCKLRKDKNLAKVQDRQSSATTLSATLSTTLTTAQHTGQPLTAPLVCCVCADASCAFDVGC
jgi:hypothetical protein